MLEKFWRWRMMVLRRYIMTATWKISNLHVAIFYSPRGRESFPPKFHLIPPKFYFTPTWRFFIFHVENQK